MLLDEDPAALIAQCTSHFKISSDTASLLRISDSLSTLSAFRSQHLQSIHSTLSSLNRTHHTLTASHNHTLGQHNPATHAADILRLDTEKFKIAKQASDLEVEGERLQQELGRLRIAAADLEEEGVEGGAEPRAGEDATVLKLKLYRTLGIDIEPDPTTGEYSKAVIRNPTKGDVHVVTIDPKFSRHFYTNYFWRTL